MDSQETWQLLTVSCSSAGWSKLIALQFKRQLPSLCPMRKLGEAVYAWANVQSVMTSGHTSFFYKKKRCACHVVHVNLLLP